MDPQTMLIVTQACVDRLAFLAPGAWRRRRNTSFEQHASTIGKRREWAESRELQVVKDGDLLRA